MLPRFSWNIFHTSNNGLLLSRNSLVHTMWRLNGFVVMLQFVHILNWLIIGTWKHYISRLNSFTIYHIWRYTSHNLWITCSYFIFKQIFQLTKDEGMSIFYIKVCAEDQCIHLSYEQIYKERFGSYICNVYYLYV